MTPLIFVLFVSLVRQTDSVSTAGQGKSLSLENPVSCFARWALETGAADSSLTRNPSGQGFKFDSSRAYNEEVSDTP